jgi:eukaryotic-like serine/threonine-protein kinase
MSGACRRWAGGRAILALAGVVSCGACGGTPQPPASSPAPPVDGVAIANATVGAERVPDVATRMVRVPAGSFRMGADDGDDDQKPAHDTRVAGFERDATEVTVAAYSACVQAGACTPPATHVDWPGVTSQDHAVFDDFCNAGRPDRQAHPVNCVDWSSADAYCRWSGKRLPTEEEWEYAARGPEGRTFPWGTDAPSAGVTNACGKECSDEMKARGRSVGALYAASDHWPFTAPVAKYPPNPFGLYDLAGNVWEWTSGHYCPYTTPSCGDPRRVARGGSWDVVEAKFLRTADRAPYDPATRNTNIGFRCVK